MNKMINMIAIKKAKNELDVMCESGKLSKYKFTPNMVYTAYACLASLCKCGETETIQKEVSDFFAKCGFNYKEKGIGYSIY